VTRPSEENPPVWADDRRGAEAYYLEHYEEIEARYQRWCRDNHKDPQEVSSMVEYEQTWL
jgi:hypothetical protein